MKDALESAFSALVNSKTEIAQAALPEGMQLLDKRLKHIILADKYGWDFIKEYKKDELASDSGDEKHIKKCLKSVTASRTQRRKFTRPRNTSIPFRSSIFPSVLSTDQGLSPSNIAFTGSRRSYFDPCHACGKYGHYWRACPFRQPGSSSFRQLVSLPSSSPSASSFQSTERSSLST